MAGALEQDLAPVARLLTERRAAATSLELDAIKRRAVAQAAREPRRRRWAPLRTRIAALGLTALAIGGTAAGGVAATGGATTRAGSAHSLYRAAKACAAHPRPSCRSAH